MGSLGENGSKRRWQQEEGEDRERGKGKGKGKGKGEGDLSEALNPWTLGRSERTEQIQTQKIEEESLSPDKIHKSVDARLFLQTPETGEVNCTVQTLQSISIYTPLNSSFNLCSVNS